MGTHGKIYPCDSHAQEPRSWPRIRARLGLTLTATLLAVAAVAPGGAGVLLAERAEADAGGVVELPATFEVTNRNGSRVPCPADGRQYTVRGHVVAPAQLLTRAAPPVTVYLHGGEISGDPVWRFKAVAGYDVAGALARLGHASLVIDRLGYGRRGLPHGKEVCLGSQADAAHQIIGKLRSGDYELAGNRPGKRFGGIALAGHSAGGLTAEIEAYSFKDIDALLVIGWADGPTSTRGAELAPRAGLICGQGGEPKYDDGSGPGGYFHLWPTSEDEARDVFLDVDPAVAAAFLPLIEKTPCGELESLSTAEISIQQGALAEIGVPVLLVYAEHDRLMGECEVDGPCLVGETQRQRYTSSPEVTLRSIAGAGHGVMLERQAQAFRGVVADWLGRHGF